MSCSPESGLDVSSTFETSSNRNQILSGSLCSVNSTIFFLFWVRLWVRGGCLLSLQFLLDSLTCLLNGFQIRLLHRRKGGFLILTVFLPRLLEGLGVASVRKNFFRRRTRWRPAGTHVRLSLKNCWRRDSPGDRQTLSTTQLKNCCGVNKKGPSDSSTKIVKVRVEKFLFCLHFYHVL